MASTDAEIIVYLDQLALHKRRRRSYEVASSGLDLLPAEQKDLLARWVKRGGRSKWETLRKDAGTSRLQLADALREWLLRHGWAAVEEERKHGDWWPLWLELRELPTLRTGLGLADKDEDARRWQDLHGELAKLSDEKLVAALESLEAMPVSRALTRCDLIAALPRWHDLQRTGTRRDFAYFARGDTKVITETEWRWLEDTVDLAEYGIERHTPMLLLSAPITLTLPSGIIDVAACPDFAILTPATLAVAGSASGKISHWILVENRTNFEREARRREPDTGIIWLPGFPPGWWSKAVSRLITLCPAPAKIACDPDPAGISIALAAAALWQQHNLPWKPKQMDASDLSSLPHRKPLTEPDRLHLSALLADSALPPALRELAVWMQQHGEKGEQEGYL